MRYFDIRSATPHLDAQQPDPGPSIAGGGDAPHACSLVRDQSPSTGEAPASGGAMRRNESAAAGLAGLSMSSDDRSDSTGAVRKNKSYGALNELSRRERCQPASPANRHAVVEAVALELLHLMTPSYSVGAGSMDEKAQQQLSAMMAYIETIVQQLDLPNSCIIAMLAYIDRAAANERFSLSVQNWQPSVLAAFVVAAKLCFDEPVWNEDFAKALRISNVPVAQISRWEASLLTLIEFNTSLELVEYANLVFRLQERYQHQHGGRSQFFTYLMLQAQTLDTKAGRAHEV